MSLYRLRRVGFQGDLTAYQVKHYTQMLMRLTTCKGLSSTRHVLSLKLLHSLNSLHLFHAFVFQFLYFSVICINRLPIWVFYVAELIFSCQCLCFWLLFFGIYQDSAIIVLNKPPKLPVKVRIYTVQVFAVCTILQYWSIYVYNELVRVMCQFTTAWMHWQQQHYLMIMMKVLNW